MALFEVTGTPNYGEGRDSPENAPRMKSKYGGSIH